MSNRVQTWVWENSDTTGNDRIVLLVLADEANDDGGSCYPSIDRIAHKARVNRATVFRCLDRLEAAGEVIVTRPKKYGRGHFNHYTVLMGRVAECDLFGEPTEVGETVEKGREKVQKRRAQTRPNPRPQTTNPETTTQEPEAPAPSQPSLEERARAILRAVHDGRRARGEPGVANWPAATGVVRKLLVAGWADERVQAACLEVPTISVGWLEGQLRGKPRPQRGDNTGEWDRNEPSGRIEL